MKLLIFLVPVCLIYSCTNSGTDVDSDSSAIDSTYCNCTELTFDQPYNHFWRFERRKGFSGICEEFYADGKLKIQKNLTEGKLHGTLTSWYDNGQIEDIKEFDMNFQVGEQFTYAKNGELVYHAKYNRGTLDTIFVNRPDLIKVDPFEEN